MSAQHIAGAMQGMCSHPHPKSAMSLASNSHCQCTRKTGQQHHVVGIVIEPTSPFSREELLPACILLTNTFYSLSWVFMQKPLNSGLWQTFIILVTSHSCKSQLPQSTFYASICFPCRERNAGLSYTLSTGEASKVRKGLSAQCLRSQEEVQSRLGSKERPRTKTKTISALALVLPDGRLASGVCVHPCTHGFKA